MSESTNEITETTADDQTDPANLAAEPDGSPEPEPAGGEKENDDAEPDTFPREYVEQLRQENAEHRTRAKDRDDLAQRLHTALVAATGRLADPTDLPFAEDHLADPDKMVAAIDALLTAKPHLASRRPAGDIGQGATPAPEPVDLAAILRANAG